jgi:predicted transcriptional regulator
MRRKEPEKPMANANERIIKRRREYFRNAIKSLKECGLSDKRIAEDLGHSVRTLYRLLNGESEVDHETLSEAQVAALIALDTKQLLG